MSLTDESLLGKMAEKYLLFSMAQRATGMDTVFRMLNLIFKEAKYLNRIPAIGEFTMSPTHNLGDSRTNLRFEDYLDLSNSKTCRFEKGYHRPMMSHLSWVKEEDLALDSYFFDKVYFLSDEEIVSEEMNLRYDVLIRRDPTFSYVGTCKKYRYGKYLIDFRYSKQLSKLTNEVLDVLGTSRAYAMTAQHYFSSRVDGADWCDSTITSALKPNTNYYACMHVRASIDDRDYEQPIFTFASLKLQIKTVLQGAIARGSKLYIMSDIHQPDFFDFLKSDYRVYRYHDFPNLKRLVSGEDDGKIDNVMLYLVEKNIMRHAMVKILPPHKGPMIYHLNTVYDLTLLKKLPVRLTIRTLRRMIHDLIISEEPLSKRLQLRKFQELIASCMKKLSPKRLLSHILIA